MKFLIHPYIYNYEISIYSEYFEIFTWTEFNRTSNVL